MRLIRGPIDTFEGVAAALGGSSGLRVVTGATPQQVSNWRASGRFPTERYLQVQTALKRKRLAARPALFRMLEPVENL